MKLLESKYEKVVNELEERNEGLRKEVERLERSSLMKEMESSGSSLGEISALRG